MWERARGCGRRPRFLEKMWPREQFHRLVGDRHLPLEDKQELGLVPMLRPGLAQVRGKLVAGLARPPGFARCQGIRHTKFRAHTTGACILRI